MLLDEFEHVVVIKCDFEFPEKRKILFPETVLLVMSFLILNIANYGR